MPAIGAEVADAYIEVHADTGPFRRELRREARLAAQEASDGFGKEFTRAVDRDLDPLGARIAEALREAGELGGRGLVDEIADQVRSRADRINTAFARSITFGDFGGFIEEFQELDDAIEDFDTRLRQLNRDGTLTNKTFDRLNASFNAYVKTIKDDAISKALDEQRKASIALVEAEEKRLARQTKINDLLSKDFQRHVDKLSTSRDKLNDALREPDRDSDAFKGIGDDLRKLTREMDKAGNAGRRFNVGLGSLKGSRNDFLNFVGSLSGFLERNIGRGIERTLDGIGSGVSKLGKSLAGFDGPLGRAGKSLDGFGSSINKLGAGGLDGLVIQAGAAIIGLQGLLAIIGPLAAGFSGLLAGTIALAVGIGGALLGGIVALGPALVAVGAGVGALALAFSDLNDEQKAVFGPLSDLLDEVRSGVQERLFSGLGGQVDSLVKALQPVGPFLTRIAGVFSDWVSEVVREIGPGGPLARTFESLGSSIPRLFGTLLDLVSATGGALTGLFAAAAPGAQRLFEGIGRVVERFSAWANSVEGAEVINSFMQRAIDLLGSLWDLATSVGETLRIMWSGGGAEAAQVLLDALTGIVDKMNEWLGTKEGQEALLRFFDNGIDVVGNLGTIVLALIGLFDALDTQFTRVSFSVITSFIVTLIEQFAKFATAGQNVLMAIGRMVTPLINLGKSFADAATSVGRAGQNMRTSVGNALTAIGTAITRAIQFINRLPNPMQAAATAGQRFRSTISTAFSGIATAASNLANRGRTALSNFATGVSQGISRAITAISRLPGQAVSAMGSFVSAIGRGVTSALTSLSAFAGRAVSALAGLAGRMVSIGLDIMAGLYRGVVSGAGRVLSYIGGLADRVASTFARALGIASPSKVFRELGGFTIDGFIQGMERREKAANKEAGDVAEGVINSAITVLERAQGSISNTARLVTSALANVGNAPNVGRAFQTLGRSAIVALTNGLTGGRDAAQKEIKNIVEQISKTARKAMEGESKKTKTSIVNQSKALQDWVKGQGKALDAVYREVDRAGTRIEAARDRLAELQKDFANLRDQTANSLRGELDLGGGLEQGETPTFESVSGQVKGLAARLKTFTALIKKLIKNGFPPALVQEIASLGTTEGIAVARAILSGTAQQQQGLINDFSAIQNSSKALGTALAQQMYQSGIDAQKGLIAGLTANQKALEQAAAKIAKTITNKIKKELGIKSPSRVFAEIGRNITDGLAQGITAGTDTVSNAMGGLIDTSLLSNVNGPISSMANQGSPAPAGVGAGGIAAGAITIVSPFANPRLVAIETLDALAQRGK